MAIITTVINFPDAVNADMLVCLKRHFGPINDPPGSSVFRDRTNAEVIAAFQQSQRNALKDIYLRMKDEINHRAVAAPADPGVI